MTPIIPILIATIASIVIGSLWYGPLFGKQWIALSNIKDTTSKKAKARVKQEMPRAFAIMTVSTVLTAAVLSVFVQWTGQVSAAGGAYVGFLAGIGFIMTTMATSYIFAGRPRGLYLIDMGYPVVSCVAMGAIIGALA